MHVAVVVLLALVTTSYACNDTICGTIPGEVKLDQADWPPSTNVVGRAAWTFLHATAAYLPHDPVTIKEKRALSYVVNGFSIIYPSPKGRELWKDVVNSKTLLAEFDHVLDRDQLILWMWKVHNCITAHLFTNKPVWPDHANLKLKREDFLVQSDGTTKMRLAALQDTERKHILAALKHRWVLPGGLEAVDVSKEAALYNSDLPPDRAGLGRATWTLLHTMSVYLPAMLTQHEQDAFCGMFDALTVIYACPVCRHHFQTVYPDPILQKEMKEINTREGAMLFLWKLHNIVVAERHPEKGLFPKSDKEIHMDMFRVPDKSKQQLQLLDLFGKYNHTLNQVLWKYQQRWKIVGGLDVSLDDFPPTPACPYTAGNRLIRVDMFVMAMCPFCAKAVKEMLAKDWINCEVECPKVGSSPAFKGTMEFSTHYVGMRNGSHLLPLHGPHELVGDKLELCARQHYAKDYKFMDFIGCMDRNITVMPALAKSCARRHGLDFKLLEACANTHGHDLLASSFAFSSSRGVDMTPLFLLNDHKKVLGLRNNFTAILCQEMREHHMPQGGHQGDKQWLHVVDAERENLAESNIAMRLFLPTPISLAATGVVLFAILVVIWRLRNNASKREEMQSLLPSRHAHARPGSRGSV